ncbi:2OG-Fe(II) oxygenase [Aquimarina sp. 2201CG1-2-11]|uniref:2OG-Fe(II) oxygenase family protein n=1 Tax=Aquimarina discodermiae TaxID=3231043 RepID=UPI0034634A8A
MSSTIKTPKVNLNKWHYDPNAFSVEEIDKIHALADTIPFKKATLNAGGNDQDDYRKSEIKWLTPQIKGIGWLYKKLTELCMKVNDSLWQFEVDEELGNLQYGVYYSDGGHYDWHMDVGGGVTAGRKISIVIQLSDPEEYEGGLFEMFVNKDVLEFPKKKGSITLFPTYCMHRVTPVTAGERRSLVLWVTGAPFK